MDLAKNVCMSIASRHIFGDTDSNNQVVFCINHIVLNAMLKNFNDKLYTCILCLCNMRIYHNILKPSQCCVPEKIFGRMASCRRLFRTITAAQRFDYS